MTELVMGHAKDYEREKQFSLREFQKVFEMEKLWEQKTEHLTVTR
jgi:hypothetical protein